MLPKLNALTRLATRSCEKWLAKYSALLRCRKPGSRLKTSQTVRPKEPQAEPKMRQFRRHSRPLELSRSSSAKLRRILPSLREVGHQSRPDHLLSMSIAMIDLFVQYNMNDRPTHLRFSTAITLSIVAACLLDLLACRCATLTAGRSADVSHLDSMTDCGKAVLLLPA